MEQDLARLEARVFYLESLVHPLPEPIRRPGASLTVVAYAFLSAFFVTLFMVTFLLMAHPDHGRFWLVGLFGYWFVCLSVSWCLMNPNKGCRKNSAVVIALLETYLFGTALLMADHLDFSQTREQYISLVYAVSLVICAWAYCGRDGMSERVRAEGMPAEPLLERPEGIPAEPLLVRGADEA